MANCYGELNAKGKKEFIRVLRKESKLSVTIIEEMKNVMRSSCIRAIIRDSYPEELDLDEKADILIKKIQEVLDNKDYQITKAS